MTTHPTDAEITRLEQLFDGTLIPEIRLICAAARDRNRLEAENAKLREALHDAPMPDRFVMDGDIAAIDYADWYHKVRGATLSQLETDNG